jgi:hypothetical protein
VDDKPGNRGRVSIRQVPIHGAVEILDRDRAIHVDRPVGLRAYAGENDFVLVGDVPDDSSRISSRVTRPITSPCSSFQDD